MKEIKLLIGEVKDRLADIEKLMAEPKTLRTERIAIRLKDKREFKLLMQHFDEIGFMPKSDSDGLSILGFPQTWQYRRNPYRPDERISIEQGYEIVDFDFFCAQKGLNQPKFIMDSVDGVPLYDGDQSWVPQCKSGGGFEKEPIQFTVVGSSKSDPSDRFSTKDAAEKWIEEQNKPKFTDVPLFRKGHHALVYKDQIELNGDGVNFIIRPSDLEEMLHALKSL